MNSWRTARPAGIGVRRRMLRVLFVMVSCAATAIGAAEIDSAGGARAFEAQLHRLLDETLAANPSLKAAGKRVAAATASAAGKKGLAPPLVGVDFYQAPLRSFPDPVGGEIDYFLQQEIPFPGKLSAMATAETKRAAMLGADEQTIAADLVRDCKAAYYALYFIDRRMELLHRNRDALKRFEEIARTRYEVGLGGQSDILRAQTELSSLVNDSIALEQNRSSTQAAINALRNAPVDSFIPAAPEIAPPFTELTLEIVERLAGEYRPELASQKLSIAMREAEAAAAKKEFFPDFMVRGTYKQMRELPDDWGVMVGVTVPIAPWSRKRLSSSVLNAGDLKEEAVENYSSMRVTVASEVIDALSRVNSSQTQIRGIRTTILPQARQTVQSTIAAYQTGKQDFLTLIDAERMSLDTELRYHTRVVELLAARAALERAVGLNIAEIELSVKGSHQ